MKKLISILISILFVITFCSCCASKKNIIMTWEKCGYIDNRGEDLDLVVYYDINTKVMYASNPNGKTVLLNPDGTPMLWEGDKE